MLTKKCYSKPELSAEQFTPNAYIALCNFTAVFHCTIQEGYYLANNSTGKDNEGYTSHVGRADKQYHGKACTKTVISSFNPETGICSGTEEGWGYSKGTVNSDKPTFDWYVKADGYNGTFEGGYGAIGAYVKWNSVNNDGTKTGYTHEGYVEKFERSGNFS